MTPARVLIVGLLVTAVVAGAGLYYLQVYAFYREVGGETVALARADGTATVLPAAGFRGIDSDSSPIRFRACFALDAPATDFQPYPLGEPLNAPGWFDCFDARAIGEALVAGEAVAVLGTPDVSPGVDRVAALFPDGQAFAWQQIDPCGELVDADERPLACPQILEGP